MRILPVLVIAILATSAAASPPPPPPDFIDELARQLTSTPNPLTFDHYAGLFANDLTVTLDGKTIAANKAQWVDIERARLGKVDRFVYGFAEGRDNVLVLDRFDDRSDEHCPSGHACLFDPRYHARAMRFEIGPDHLVHTILIVQSDGLLRTP